MNAAKWVLKNSEWAMDTNGYEVVMKVIKVYFQNLTVAATNRKSVLEQLVAKNSKLAATNE